jgi:hypothetical protein
MFGGDTIFFITMLIAVCVVVYWAATNDNVAPGEPTHGLLAMRDEKLPPEPGTAEPPPKVKPRA